MSSSAWLLALAITSLTEASSHSRQSARRCRDDRSRSRSPPRKSWNRKPPPPRTKLPTLPADWQEYRDDDGRPYYVHKDLATTQWERPGQITPGAVKLLDGKQFQEQAKDIIKGAGKDTHLTLLGYNIDRKDIVDELIAARTRGANVSVVLDEATHFEGKAIFQREVVQKLTDAHIPLRLVSGEDNRYEMSLVDRQGFHVGKLHAKALLMEDSDGAKLLTGSANWTTGSRTNIEIATLVHLNEQTWRQSTEFFSKMWQRGRTMTDALRSRKML